MLLLTARFVLSQSLPYDDDPTARKTFLMLPDGRQLLVDVREVAVAFEIEKPGA